MTVTKHCFFCREDFIPKLTEGRGQYFYDRDEEMSVYVCEKCLFCLVRNAWKKFKEIEVA